MPTPIQQQPAPSATPSNAYPNLDFLRACAVMFVFVDHTLSGLPVNVGGLKLVWLGMMGVMFFFVHTSCVLLMSLERHKGPHYFRNFYVRRVFRIYPLSIVVVLLLLVLRPDLKLAWWEWCSNFLLVQDLTFSGHAMLPLWTLPIEVRMYFLLPFVYWFARRATALWQMLGLFVLSIPLVYWVPLHVARAVVVVYAPLFLCGAISYWMFRHKRALLPSAALPVLIGLITIAFLRAPDWKFAAWGACLTLGITLPLIKQISSARVNRVSSEIAKYSYSIYLLHSLWLNVAGLSWAHLPLYLIGVSILSVVSYNLIEQPFIKLANKLVSSPSRTDTEATATVDLAPSVAAP